MHPYFPDDIRNWRIDEAPYYKLTDDDLAFVESRVPGWIEDHGKPTALDRPDAIRQRLMVEVAFCELFRMDRESSIRKRRIDGPHSFTLGRFSISVVATMDHPNASVSRRDDERYSDFYVIGLLYHDGDGYCVKLLGVLPGASLPEYGPRRATKPGVTDYYLIFGYKTQPVASWFAEMYRA